MMMRQCPLVLAARHGKTGRNAHPLVGKGKGQEQGPAATLTVEKEIHASARQMRRKNAILDHAQWMDHGADGLVLVPAVPLTHTHVAPNHAQELVQTPLWHMEGKVVKEETLNLWAVAEGISYH